jgi:hypothetical protein
MGHYTAFKWNFRFKLKRRSRKRGRQLKEVADLLVHKKELLLKTVS